MCRHHYMAEYNNRPDRVEAKRLWHERQLAEPIEYTDHVQELTPEQRLQRARVCYDRVCGVEGRLRWKRIVRYVEQELPC
jgi:hypothetical protein